MRNFFTKFLAITLISFAVLAQVIEPFSFWKTNFPPLIISPNPIYVQAGGNITLTGSGGSGYYVWSNTAGAISDGADVIADTPTTADYTGRTTAYATDTVTLTAWSVSTTATATTYAPLTISPTMITMAINSSQTFTGAGGCLNGTACVGGALVFSKVSGGGIMNSATGAYTTGAVAGADVVQVADSIGNVATATIRVVDTLTISPDTLRLSVFSTNIFTAILGTAPYIYTVPVGTGTVNLTTGLFTAPGTIESDTVRVTDAGMFTSNSAVTIIEPIEIVGSQYNVCARHNEGSVKCWGSNNVGQVGVGSVATIGDATTEVGGANQFVNLGTGRTATRIVAGLLHVCAILDNGSVKCWGGNANGQLGLGDTANRGDAANEMGDNLPAVSLGTGKTAVNLFAFGYVTCAILNDTSLKCWGLNSTGQLGIGNVTGNNIRLGDQTAEMGDSLLPINLGTGKTAVQVTGGLDFTCARLNDSNVKCWGNNNRGQLGKDNTTVLGNDPNEMGDNLTNINITGASGSARTALEISSGYEHTCVRRDDNTITCWGRNNNGQVGKGNTGGANASIGDVGGEMAVIGDINMNTGFGTAANLFAYGRSQCAKDTAGVVKCWGRNTNGQLLHGNTTTPISAPIATAVSFGTGLIPVKISGEWYTPCALFTNKRIKCWGRGVNAAGNSIGMFLNGNTTADLGISNATSGDNLLFLNH